MTSMIRINGLEVEETLFNFVAQEACPGSSVSAETFWQAVEDGISRFASRNAALLAQRETLQQQIDEWHRARKGMRHDPADYKAFLTEIGYLIPEGESFKITTANVDAEIADIAGPQLVVPIKNARFALNAANARWGSLYDALYGTDAIAEEGGGGRGGAYNPIRGAKVIARGRALLDQVAPLKAGSHSDVRGYEICETGLVARLEDGTITELTQSERFRGFVGPRAAPSHILLQHHHLHLDIIIDKDHPVGQDDRAHIADIMMESAVTTILDCEDSVAAVDGPDKTECYHNLLGLITGTLECPMIKDGQHVVRRLTEDWAYHSVEGKDFSVPGRSLLLIRNVGHLMTSPAVTHSGGQEIPEGLLDTYMTALIAGRDILAPEAGSRNSRTGSIYIVKPKMHGPEEVAFAVEMFAAAEDALGLPERAMKIGIMDEERRTTVNLKECIRAARDRVIFINTGFLDRTGDEIHTSMEAGPFLRKEDIKTAPWLAAYEDWNVDIGLECGFANRAQIGKGMWPKPDNMAQMLEAKIAHPASGANCAWAPSPTAATLHALHYHEISVKTVQTQIASRRRASLDDILTIPLAGYAGEGGAAILPTPFSPEEVEAELENNAQSILGYVVRWIDQGVGCSKVPDITNTGLMEDRATLRISSQHMANWLHHGIVTDTQLRAVLEKMARIVDAQNADDPAYQPMSADFSSSLAFAAACDLVFKGRKQPSGYTEPLLHQRRRKVKAISDT